MKIYGVSDVAIGKRARQRALVMPGIGYWNKVEAGLIPHPDGRPDVIEVERAALTSTTNNRSEISFRLSRQTRDSIDLLLWQQGGYRSLILNALENINLSDLHPFDRRRAIELHGTGTVVTRVSLPSSTVSRLRIVSEHRNTEPGRLIEAALIAFHLKDQERQMALLKGTARE